MNLTTKQLVVILKKAYMRGVWDHVEQGKTHREGTLYVNIPESFVKDLIEENTNE